MMSTESQATNQPASTSIYDERLFNERIRQIFNSIDSATLSHSALSPPLAADTGPMTSIVDALFPEQATLNQQQKQRDQQRHASTNDLTSAFDRFPLWNQSSSSSGTTTGSASAFCGGTVNGAASAFANRRQGKLHSSTRSLRNGNYANHSTSAHYRPPPTTRPRFTSSAIRLPAAATLSTAAAAPLRPVAPPSLQRSSSSSLSVNNGSGATAEYQPRFASRLSNSRLPTVAGVTNTSSTGPVGSHDQIVGNGCVIDPIAPPSNSSSATAVLARSISSSNAQPTQQFVTMTQTTTTTFCYVPASGSLAYNTLPGPTRAAATIPHH